MTGSVASPTMLCVVMGGRLVDACAYTHLKELHEVGGEGGKRIIHLITCPQRPLSCILISKEYNVFITLYPSTSS